MEGAQQAGEWDQGRGETRKAGGRAGAGKAAWAYGGAHKGDLCSPLHFPTPISAANLSLVFILPIVVFGCPNAILKFCNSGYHGFCKSTFRASHQVSPLNNQQMTCSYL